MGKQYIKHPAVFLDRDGTLIYSKNYLSSPGQVKLYSYTAESINKLKRAGFKVIVVTNQSGIARGMFTLKDLDKIHKKFLSLLKIAGASIDGIYFCPHVDADNCQCRKPKVGMVMQGSKDFNIDLKKSYTVGDSIRDYLLGFNVGGKGILVLTGHGKNQKQKINQEKIKPFAVCKDLKQAVNLIVRDVKKC
ncbi:MAG: HAD family hydrolase [Endomicrobium sp.]|uniref:D-glycero-alpha-D-manno-heptose-1,7-bisphosphate 7-phosphatase n=1 Tax=Candidatus Endomicrobiellum cubanum TaxID=3242325 RepID=UPI002826E429|nr:HAD family hydrolase [Endomicrobium sp.]MDR2396085.1 HAD family hydrolase [Endomicrobium sp.]